MDPGGLCKRVVFGHAGTGARDPGAVLRCLRIGQTEIAETILLVAVLAQLGEEAGGGALGRGGWIVQLVREVCGELAQGGELLGLLLHAGYFAGAVQQHGDAALRHRRDCSQHLGEDALVNIETPHRADGIAVATIALHAREGELARHLACAADPQSGGTGVAAAHVNLAHQDEVKLVDGAAFEEDDGTVFACGLGAVRGEPGVFGFGKAIERWNRAQGGDEPR